MAIATSTIIDTKSNWQIRVTDLTALGTRFHANPNKINYCKIQINVILMDVQILFELIVQVDCVTTIRLTNIHYF